MVDLCEEGLVVVRVAALSVGPMCSTELETGSVQTPVVVIRTLPGEQSVISVRLQNLKASFLLHSHPKVMKEVEAVLA